MSERLQTPKPAPASLQSPEHQKEQTSTFKGTREGMTVLLTLPFHSRFLLSCSPINTVALVAFLVLLAITSFGQGVINPPKVIEVDLINKQFKGKLPFDARFELMGTPLASSDKMTLVNIKQDNKPDNLLKADISWERRIPRTRADESKAEKFYFLFSNKGYLRPNHKYTFLIKTFEADPNTTGAFLEKEPITIVGYTESSLADHVKIDFGIGYAPKPQAIIGLTTAHVYLTPLNEDTDLADEDLEVSRHLLQRISVFAGLSPVTFSEQTEKGMKEKYELGNFVYGIGVRSLFYSPWLNTGHAGRVFLQPLRVNVGILNYKQPNANPAISDNVSKRAPYISLTYDLNISTILGPIGALLLK